MRFRRRADDVGAADPARGALAVDFAGVLDGRRLWVAVPAARGRIALRSSGGALVDLPDEGATGPAQPGFVAARLDLAPLPPTEAAYDVVLVDGDAVRPLTGEVVPTWRRPDDGPGRRLETDDGVLRLRTSPVVEAATLVSASLQPDGIRLGLDRPGPVVLVGDDGVLAGWDDGWLDESALDGVAPQDARVLVGTTRLPVWRRDNDLRAARRGAPLPSTPRLRLHWTDAGVLAARVGAPAGEVTS
ncbi:hypothetical protein ABFT23_21625 [Nocardioides sp. C4-1]|uniref:hypothetical protein n=1 Tax=Nocardioides sp. C4-1 TaxID=3151851 RepID=UPI0032660BDF